ncbi:MAG: serine hydrolase domain-containing protein [Bacteroidota bacterium]
MKSSSICFSTSAVIVPTFSQNITITADVEKQIEELFMDYQNKPGCAVGIYHQGEIIYEKGYGYANLEHQVKVVPESIFDVASISKQFTAACVLLLEEEGKLDLDDPIQKYLPELPTYAKGAVTIRHLLHHTSGFKDYLAVLHFIGKSWDMNFTEEDGLDLLKQLKVLNFTPGEQYSYSNSNYLALGIIVQRLSGQSINEYAQENILQPLGMNHSFFYEDSKRVIPNRTIGYTDEGNGYEREHFFNFIVPGDGGLHTNIGDFLKWSNNYRSSKIGAADFVEKLLTKAKLNNGNESTYAMGVEHGLYLGYEFFGHNGSWGGSRSMFLQFPSADLAVMVMSNNGTINVWGKAYQLAGIVLPENQIISESEGAMTATPIRTPIELSKQQLEQFCGNFVDLASGYDRRIYFKDGSLYYYRAADSESRIFPVGESEFGMEGASGDLLISFREEGGQRMMYVTQGENEYVYEGYTPASYSSSDLQRFAGQYRAAEFEASYEIKVLDGQLILSVGEAELESFRPAMTNVFCSDHLGYLRFSDDGKRFLLTDDALGALAFEKIH